MNWTCGDFTREVVRLMEEEGLNRRQIADRMGMKYQEVQNAVTRYQNRGAKVFESKRPLRTHKESEIIRREAVRLFHEGMTIPDIAEKLGCSYTIAYRAVVGIGYVKKSKSATELNAGIEVGNRIRRLKETIRTGDEVLFYKNREMTHGTVSEIYTNFVRIDTGDGKVNVQYIDLI